jgi:hypothetical protein
MKPEVGEIFALDAKEEEWNSKSPAFSIET